MREDAFAKKRFHKISVLLHCTNLSVASLHQFLCCHFAPICVLPVCTRLLTQGCTSHLVRWSNWCMLPSVTKAPTLIMILIHLAQWQPPVHQNGVCDSGDFVLCKTITTRCAPALHTKASLCTRTPASW